MSLYYKNTLNPEKQFLMCDTQLYLMFERLKTPQNQKAEIL